MISQDALFNLHEIVQDILRFVEDQQNPDLLCICGLLEIVEEPDRILVLEQHNFSVGRLLFLLKMTHPFLAKASSFIFIIHQHKLYSGIVYEESLL